MGRERELMIPRFGFLLHTSITKYYRVAQNQGKQVLGISHVKFHFPTIQFVVIPHGQRDLSSLPWTGEAAVQIL